METAYYLKKLKEDFSRRQRLNKSYSLRAYARDLGVPASTMSQVLLGNRPLPLKNTNRVLEKIQLNAKERTLFVDSLGQRHIRLDSISIPTHDDRFLIDEAYYQIISEWEHDAILVLFDCEEEMVDAEIAVRRLGITQLRAEVVIENLIKFGLLGKNADGRLVRTQSRFRTTEDVASQALRASHRETLEIGKQKLEEVEVELRDFSSMMVALDLEKLPEAKTIIREFRQKLYELLKSGDRTEVYQLGIQFYPMTRPDSKSKKPVKRKQEEK